MESQGERGRDRERERERERKRKERERIVHSLVHSLEIYALLRDIRTP